MNQEIGLCTRGLYGYRDAVRFDRNLAEEIEDLSNLLVVVNKSEHELTRSEIDLVLRVTEEPTQPQWAVAS
jgi:hypothetical protein